MDYKLRSINSLLFKRLMLNNKISSIYLTVNQKNALNIFHSKLSLNTYFFEEAHCVCGSLNGLLLARRDRYGFDVNTYLCRSCGIMWTNPRMTKESLNKFYEDDYREIYSSETKEILYNKQIKHGEFILNYVSKANKPLQKNVVFDVGCGTGGTLVPFVNAGWAAYGCDLGDEHLEYGKATGLNLTKGSIEGLLKYGKADLIIMSHVIEHLPDPQKTILEISKALSDNGYIYVELPGIFNIHNAYGNLLNFLQNAHLYHFTLFTLNRLLAQLGFIMVKGDECVHALFRKNQHPFPVKNRNQLFNIILYLIFLEQIYIISYKFPTLYKARNLIKRILKAYEIIR